MNASAARPTGSSRSITRAPIAPSTLRSSACAQTAPNRPGAGADDRDRLVAQRARRERAREPVERVLELARDRVVVLRRGEEHDVGLVDRGGERAQDPRARLAVVVVGVVGRHRLQALPQLQLGPGRQQLLPPPGGAAALWESRRRLPEIPRTFIYAWTSWRSTCRRTSLASARPPLGSGLFQLRPKCVRSTDGLERDADARVPPNGSSCGASSVAAGLDRARVALDREVAVDDELVAVEAPGGRLERDRRVALGVEELGRLQVGVEVLVLDGDRGRDRRCRSGAARRRSCRA